MPRKAIKMTRTNAKTVLMNIADRIKESPEDGKVWCDELNKLCDELLGDDFFGTEGQLDPRGDHRN